LPLQAAYVRWLKDLHRAPQALAVLLQAAYVRWLKALDGPTKGDPLIAASSICALVEGTMRISSLPLPYAG